MGGFDLSAMIQAVAIAALPIVLAITLHEAAHGYAAKHFGDPTAYLEGRISANPLRTSTRSARSSCHLPSCCCRRRHPVGWAKPVPVNFGNLRRPKRDMLWVAAAGPGAQICHGDDLGARAEDSLDAAAQPFQRAHVGNG